MRGVVFVVIAVAAAQGCHDYSQCQSYVACSDSNALHRAGNLCDDFPWYNGGAPLEATPWRWQTIWGDCTNATCAAWSTVNDDGAVAQCSCDDSTCTSWQCGAMRCACSDTCSLWYCADGAGRTANGSCSATRLGHCDLWDVAYDTGSEFGVQSCRCTVGQAVCEQWVCTDKALRYMEPNNAWIAFGVILGCLFTTLMVRNSDRGGSACVVMALLGTWMVVVYMGGVFALIISVCVTFVWTCVIC